MTMKIIVNFNGIVISIRNSINLENGMILFSSILQ